MSQKLSRVSRLLTALTAIAAGCGGGGGDGGTGPPGSATNDLEFRGIDRGGGHFEVVLEASELGTLGVSGMAFSLRGDPATALAYQASSSSIGPFFSNGQFAAGFVQGLPSVLCIGAGIPPTSVPFTGMDPITVLTLYLEAPPPPAGETVILNLEVDGMRLYRRDTAGGYAIELPSTSYTCATSFDVQLQG